jgi:general secretion pathway protein J
MGYGRRQRRADGAGFTLIEVLIAMAITAFVAAAAYAGISSVLTGSERLQEAQARVEELNRALAFLNRDLRQFVDRPVRDEYGELQPALTGGPLAFFPLSLTRGGWHNSQGLPRSDLQRVQYYLEDGALWRAYYPVLDRVPSTARLETRLLDGVDSLELRFLRQVEGLRVSREGVVDTASWEGNWIPDTSTPSAPLAPPVALELRLDMGDLGSLRRLYVLPGR